MASKYQGMALLHDEHGELELTLDDDVDDDGEGLWKVNCELHQVTYFTSLREEVKLLLLLLLMSNGRHYDFMGWLEIGYIYSVEFGGCDGIGIRFRIRGLLSII